MFELFNAGEEDTGVRLSSGKVGIAGSFLASVFSFGFLANNNFLSMCGLPSAAVFFIVERLVTILLHRKGSP